jgi:hypothetical protein
MSTNTMPRPIASTATPKATTDVNSDACRNDAVITVCRFGSSGGSSAYVRPPAISPACRAMTSACAYACHGCVTFCPANASASSETVMFCSASVVETTT